MLAASPLLAQGGPTLTLEDAIRIALERSYDVQRSKNSVQQSQTSVEQARANFLPNLSASLGPSIRFGTGGDGFGGSGGGTSTSLSLSTSSSINVFNGYADVASLAQARNQLTASSAALGRTEEQVAYEAATDFIQVILNRELIRTAQEHLQAQRDQLDLIEALATAGARPKADVYTQRAATASAELQLLNTQHDFELSVIRLKQLLQLDPATDYQLVTPPSEPLADTSATQRDQTAREAIAGRADIRAQQARITAAQEAIRVARAGYYPTVGVNGGIGTSFSSQDPNTGFINQLADNPSLSIGATLSIPIFDKGRTRNAEEQAQIQYENEILSLRTLEQQAALEVQQAYLDYSTAAKQLDVAQAQLEAARQALDAQQERYRVGLATLAELSTARADFTQASVSRTQAEYTLLLRRRAIEFYRGIAR